MRAAAAAVVDGAEAERADGRCCCPIAKAEVVAGRLDARTAPRIADVVVVATAAAVLAVVDTDSGGGSGAMEFVVIVDMLCRFFKCFVRSPTMKTREN